jgi:hypothetical protein
MLSIAGHSTSESPSIYIISFGFDLAALAGSRFRLGGVDGDSLFLISSIASLNTRSFLTSLAQLAGDRINLLAIEKIVPLVYTSVAPCAIDPFQGGIVLHIVPLVRDLATMQYCQ